MNLKKTEKILFPALLFCMSSLFCSAQKGQTVLQVGHFPNISHAQALVAHQMSFENEGKGWFEERLGGDVKIVWRIYNAGPTAMEAFFTGALDITYVGPSPALNAYTKTAGKDIKILSGSADGGAALVVNPKLNIKDPKDFKSKRIGTPQLGNTQDVACRAWLIANGLKVTLSGGDASVLPTSNPDQLLLFSRGDLDAVWTVEPWVSRLEKESGAVIFLEQKEAVTTVLATCNRALNANPELIKKFVVAHHELTDWINQNPEKAKELARKALERLTGGKVAMTLVDASWPRLIFTNKLNVEELKKFANYAYECGFLKKKIDIQNLIESAK